MQALHHRVPAYIQCAPACVVADNVKVCITVTSRICVSDDGGNSAPAGRVELVLTQLQVAESSVAVSNHLIDDEETKACMAWQQAGACAA